MKIAIACDPAGMPLKGPIEETLTELGIEYVDLGMHEGDCRDYPVFALRVANKVVNKECDFGIVLCGTGVGISIAANKVDGIRCCHCSDCYSAKMSRAHNDANMLAMGAGVIIARHYGARDFTSLKKVMHTVVAFGLIVGLFLTVTGVALSPEYIPASECDPALGADENLLALIRQTVDAVCNE